MSIKAEFLKFEEFETEAQAKQWVLDHPYPQHHYYQYGAIFKRHNDTFGVLLHGENRYMSSYIPDSAPMVTTFEYINNVPVFETTNTRQSHLRDIEESGVDSELADIMKWILRDD